MSLTKEIAKWGNTAALRIPRPFMVALGLDISSKVELDVVKGALVIRPVEVSDDLSLDELLRGASPEKCRLPEGDSWQADRPVGQEIL